MDRKKKTRNKQHKCLEYLPLDDEIISHLPLCVCVSCIFSKFYIISTYHFYYQKTKRQRVKTPVSSEN